MKVRLLHPERDEPLLASLPTTLGLIVEEDLDLGSIYTAMADGDAYLGEVARKVIQSSLTDPDIIRYRQQVYADIVANLPAVQQVYEIAVGAEQVQRRIFLGGLMSHHPTTILSRAVHLLELLTDDLQALRKVCDQHGGQFKSPAFTQFWAMVADQLDDDYLARVRAELTELDMPNGTALSARLGLGNKGVEYRPHRSTHHNWWERFTGRDHPGLSFTIDDRDEAGSDALTELAGRAVNELANTATQAADHIQAFFVRVRCELGFYLGCHNLQARLGRAGIPTCVPTPVPARPRQFHCTNLRDIALCLNSNRQIVGNSVDADGKALVIITGANEGGKSTFLRSVGSAQLMMQAGMFVVAEKFTASVAEGVYTHFKREEDATMTHGKLDEELARMSEIADAIQPDSLLLCNESFASTTEREGSQIARGIVDTFISASINVVYVTHLFDLADSLYQRHDPDHLFLRAQRRDDATRTFRLAEAAPAETSHGLDSFARVFGRSVDYSAHSR
jgi:hypothetical protein